MAHAPKALAALIGGRRAGTLLAEPSGALRFEYDSAYADDPDATPLSLSMPIEGGRYTDRAVRSVIAGLLPDNEHVLDRWGRLFGVSARNPFALLTHVGEDCAGAVQFVPEDRADGLGDGSVEWLTDADVEGMLAALRRDPHGWQQRGPNRGGHFSLAGAQPKVALLRHAGRWGRPTGAVPTTHILKPAIAGLVDHDLNEHLCLMAARALGLRAARSEIVRFGEERAIAVTRFDRVADDRRSLRSIARVHQEDTCQALGRPPTAKYQADGGPSPREIVGLLRNHQSAPVAATDVERFVAALAFQWVIAGTDAHAKNYGLLLAGRQVRLSPLYDVASAVVHPDFNPHRWELAMRINKEGRLKHLARKDWEVEAASMRLDVDGVVATIDRFSAAICDEMAKAAADPAVVDAGGDSAARLVDGLAVHVRAVRRAMGLR